MSSSSSNRGVNSAGEGNSDQNDPNRLPGFDARLRSLNLPKTPYLKNISNTPPFVLDSEQEAGWLKGTLFKPGEEMLQYATFLGHNLSEPVDAERIADWDDGKGGISQSSAAGGSVRGTDASLGPARTHRRRLSSENTIARNADSDSKKSDPATSTIRGDTKDGTDG
jgi:hypothetical protein